MCPLYLQQSPAQNQQDKKNKSGMAMIMNAHKKKEIKVIQQA